MEPAFIDSIRHRISRLDPIKTPKALLLSELEDCLVAVAEHHLATCKKDDGPDCVVACMLITTIKGMLDATMRLKRDRHSPDCPLYTAETPS